MKSEKEYLESALALTIIKKIIIQKATEHPINQPTVKPYSSLKQRINLKSLLENLYGNIAIAFGTASLKHSEINMVEITIQTNPYS